MAYQQVATPWTQPGWFEQASLWIYAELAARGIDVTGSIEQPRAYPWSTVLRVPTSHGTLFFKASSPVDPFEPAVLETLARWRPDCTPRLVSIDAGRGWMLMRDAGRMFRQDIRPARDMRPWLAVLPLYAELQIELAERVPELLALGVPDRRLAMLPRLYGPLLADRETLRIGREPGLTLEQYRRLVLLTPRVAELCARLAEFSIPESLNHGDLNDGNILVGDGRTVFIDWGDACVSHPFFSLRTVLVSAEISLELEDNSPATQPLRDAYLEPWTRYETRQRLLRALELSSRLASINGALTWHRLVSRLEQQPRDDYAEPVPALLQEFLDAVS